jgi:hypothetical protein
MADKLDPNLTKRYLGKAQQQDHPVVNFRLGHIYYRNREYTKPVPFLKEHWTVPWKRN